MPIHVGVSDCAKLSDSFECGRELVRDACSALPGPPQAIVLFSPYKGVDHARLLAGVRSAAGACVVFGGTTYGGILGSHLREESVVLMALGGDIRASTGVGKGLAKGSFEAGRDAALAAREGLDGRPGKLFLLIHEPQMGDPVKILEGARSVLGADFPIIGGGSGTGFVMEQTPLSKQFIGDKVLAGSAAGLLLGGDFQFSCGFSHGGVPISKAFRLTKARGNVFVELDGRPALDVMEEALSISTQDISVYSFNMHCGLIQPEAKDFVLYGLWGVNKRERTLVSGTPIQEGGTYCFVRLPPESILEATREAARKAASKMRKPRGAICFDCYGRKMQLGAHGLIDEELKAIHDAVGSIPLAGMYAGSEIAPPAPATGAPFSRYGHSSTSFVLLGDA